MGVKLTLFPLHGSTVPYCYSPVLLARADAVGDEGRAALLAAFLAAAARGYEAAAAEPEAAGVAADASSAAASRESARTGAGLVGESGEPL